MTRLRIPLLTAIPLGLVLFEIVADLLYLSTGYPGFAYVAYWNLSGMVIAGAVATAFGAWSHGLARNASREANGLDAREPWPGLPSVIVVALFAASWVMRRYDASLLPSVPALSTSFCAAVVAIFAGGLGGLTGFHFRGDRHPRSTDSAASPRAPLRPAGSGLVP